MTMKKMIFASLAILAFASCSKESFEDPSITATGDQISFNAYSELIVSKGAPITSNTDFKTVGKFTAAAYDEDGDAYIPFSTVTYETSSWDYASTYYWPATGSLTFAAYYPDADATTTVSSAAYDGTDFTFDYTASTTVASQVDVMFALNKGQTKVEAVPMHFKHALTQVGFAVATDPNAGIEVSLKSITICNVKPSGEFKAADTTNSATTTTDGTVEDKDVEITSGEWTTSGNLAKYTAVNNTDTEDTNNGLTFISEYYTVTNAGETTDVATDYTYTQFTSSANPLMLIPQELTAWIPTNITEDANVTSCYLAIECKIIHHDGTTAGSTIVDGTIYVPFNSKDDSGAEVWLAGNKLTYNLLFGGGYPYEPGDTPDDDDPDTPDVDESIPTLVPITYTVTVDAWKEVAAIDLATTDTADGAVANAATTAP